MLTFRAICIIIFLPVTCHSASIAFLIRGGNVLKGCLTVGQASRTLTIIIDVGVFLVIAAVIAGSTSEIVVVGILRHCRG
ncbi:hypothetical protein F5879DRAFT_977182 [Lentinula edodes]|nr:hypothetical protein F5879DRAFT_977182 [Lentinula edodes]